MPITKKKSDGANPEVIASLRKSQCSIYYEKSVTKNLGNYESAKVTVGVTLPIEPTDEEVELIKATLIKGDNLVTEELEEQLQELQTAK